MHEELRISDCSDSVDDVEHTGDHQQHGGKYGSANAADFVHRLGLVPF
jgi:hypothetical protein